MRKVLWFRGFYRFLPGNEVRYFITHRTSVRREICRGREFMRNRKVQRLLRKMKEERLPLRNQSWGFDLTPHGAVDRMIRAERKRLLAAADNQGNEQCSRLLVEEEQSGESKKGL